MRHIERIAMKSKSMKQFSKFVSLGSLLSITLTTSFFLSSTLVVDVLSPFALSASAYAADEGGKARKPPTKTTDTATSKVSSRIQEVQELQGEGAYLEALEILDEVQELYDRDRLNNYEKYLMFVFYAMISGELERDADAIKYYEELVRVPDLDDKKMSQVHLSLGGLYNSAEDLPASITNFEAYLDYVLPEDVNLKVYLQISYLNFQLDQFDEALPWDIRYLEAERSLGESPRDGYDLLQSIYLSQENYPALKQLTREMTVIFDLPKDMRMYAQMEYAVDNFDKQTSVSYVANIRGFLDKGNQVVSLASQIYGKDNFYGAAMILEEGFAKGTIEADDEEAYQFLSICYQLAREDEKAVAPLIRAIELTDDADYHKRLGQLYYNLSRYEDAIEAYDKALDADVGRKDQVLMTMANAYTLLDRFDEAIAAAERAAREDSRMADTAVRNAGIYRQQKARYDSIQAQRKEFAAYFR